MSRQDDSAPYAQRQGFHPEFGYLCPSTALRRRVGYALKLGIAAVAVLAGAAFGLSSVLTTSPQPQVAREQPVVAQPAPLPDPAEQAMPMVPADATVQSASQSPAPVRSAAPSGPAALAHAQASCADLSESFLSPQCQTARKSRAARAAEAASRRIAGVTLGRADAVPEGAARALPQKVAREKAPSDAAAVEQAAPAQAAPHSAPVDVNAATAKAAVGASPDDPAAAPDKPRKLVKTARKRVPRDDAPVAAAPPPTPQPTFGLFGLFHELARVANGPSTASWQ